MNLPSLRQLQYLRAVAAEGSFSRAAEACHVTQSTLSAGIAALESLLKQSLIDRSQTPVVLTALGAEVAESAHRLINEASALVERARHLNAPLSGPLRLGIIPTIAPYLMPSLLPVLQKRFPQLELQLHEDLSARLAEGLRKGDLDLILLAFPYDTPGMTQRILFEEPFYLACPKGQWKGMRLKTTDLEKLGNLILLEEGHCLRDHALAACHLQPLPQRRAFSATSLPTLLQMVRHGYGTTLLPEMVVKSGVASNMDVIPFSDAPPPSRTIGMAWRRNSPAAAEYEILCDILTPPSSE